MRKTASIPLYALLIVMIHIVAITLLLIYVRTTPALLASAILAYTYGARHAFDADHIVAIDNTVRKLVSKKTDGNGVGFFFSMGHSTVVILMIFVLIWVTGKLSGKWAFITDYGPAIGTIVAGTFLILIAISNIISLRKLIRAERAGVGMDEALASRGFIVRLVEPLNKFVTKSWHIYPIGFLFGLGFDTATEIGLITISVQSSTTVSALGLLCLPLSFLAGMCLFDTLDSIIMSQTYGWAYDNHKRRYRYNVIVTVISVVSAVIVGSTILLQFLLSYTKLNTTVSHFIEGIDFNGFGITLMISFLVIWLCAMLISKYQKRT
ncbi:nickel transport protein [Listeria weihenstephanensis FSL R9-0317]|uniref:Nickel/cobalt efflux system n=1 Tax=Listeria weihenstephanensis TaxID=1006155 RepID=A0A1S7FR20_9LIST|nr:hypothetical protein [Listeria weihenstephanensis]AQY49809.1 hypothetical protein UE46_01200 [Listeria weihenstephanensis]EUJ34689.1 nickel transport protein [Listeria weihenstephanensis FSL R9-0317]